MQWLKLNWFKSGILLFAVVFGLWYRFSWVYGQQEREDLVNQIKCQQEGFQLFEKDKVNLTDRDVPLTPEFRFVKNLNTCLYSGAFAMIDDSGSSFEAFIKDVYTNKDLASYTSISVKNKDTKLIGDKEKYDLLRAEYFPKN